MSDIKFDSNQVENTINAIDSKNEKLNEILSKSSSYVNDLSWEGDAYDAFNACFVDLKNKCDAGYSVNKSYIAHLNLSKVKYEATEAILKENNLTFD